MQLDCLDILLVVGSILTGTTRPSIIYKIDGIVSSRKYFIVYLKYEFWIYREPEDGCSLMLLFPSCALHDDIPGMQLSGNKVRKLELLLGHVIAQGADCIVTIGGIQSNHCRATAVAAKYLNLDCYLILRTSKLLVDKDPGLIGNLLVERLIGAHIDLVSKEEYAKVGSEALTKLLKEKFLNEGRKLYVIPVGGSNSLGTWGYIEAIREVEQQLQHSSSEWKFDDIVVSCGSGGYGRWFVNCIQAQWLESKSKLCLSLF
nr:putative D-cysteine desulfhydrase 1, mitochondrial [Nicotiana tomentosiformis]